LEVGSFAAETSAVVHDFTIDLAGCEVDETQGFPQKARTAQLLARKNIPLGARGFYITGAGCKAGYSGDPCPKGVQIRSKSLNLNHRGH
jgi:hypothetical protein